ncbi:MAG TPA: dihydrolipoamide dehydrogenase [Holosporales bacterium]|nr:dihydrolipoamide dehydrogenase [Holosporales bacterium]
MTTQLTDICIIGAGSGGLSLAAGASQMGASVTLIERGKMGGDCLNYGCVPSKALLAAGKVAHTFRHSQKFGITPQEPNIDFKAVHNHVHDVMAQIEPNDSQSRFEKLGVHVIRKEASFVDKHTIQAGDTLIKARHIVIATGSSAFVPPLKGLENTPYLTNETIFDLTECPKHLLIIGGGPIGIEMAQAHRRLGAEVTVITSHGILPKDDPELIEVVKKHLLQEGVKILEDARVEKVAKTTNGVSVITNNATLKGSHLLVATGRQANLESLNLKAAEIAHTPRGISVNPRLQTSQKNIYAMGDCTGGYQFTHVASYHAGIIIRNILFKLPAKIHTSAIPWVTYCDPELAHVGLSNKQALESFPDARTLRWPFAENDRALAERASDGLIKISTKKNGEVLGASIVGKNAGDLLLPWVLAVKEKKKIADIATLIAPYPTFSEVSKRVAGSFFTPKLFSPKTNKIVRFLMKWFS